MKKQSFTITRKGIYLSALTATILLTTLFTAQAANADPVKPEVQYAGKADKYLTFDVGFQNADQKKFTLQLLDKENHEVLYQKEYKDSAFSKKIYLMVENTSCTVTFRIKSGKEVYDQSFNINTETKLVDDMLVTKL